MAPALQPLSVFILILCKTIHSQAEESIFFDNFDQQTNWNKNNGSFNPITDAYDPVTWLSNSGNCPVRNSGDTSSGSKSCIRLVRDAFVSRIISTVGYHSIRLEIDVNPMGVEQSDNDWCIIQYRTATTNWVNVDIAQGDDIETLNFEISITNLLFANQESFEVKVGIAANAGGDYCLFDNFEVFGVPLSNNPTQNPSQFPSVQPTVSPTNKPTLLPTLTPSQTPSVHPTIYPSDSPTDFPTKYPTVGPTVSPTIKSSNPTNNPTVNPSVYPSLHPTIYPSNKPTQSTTLNTTKETKEPTRNDVVVESTIFSTFSMGIDAENETYIEDMMSDGAIGYIVIGIIFILIIVVVVIILKLMKKLSGSEQKSPDINHIIPQNDVVPVNKNKNEPAAEFIEGKEDIEIKSENILRVDSNSMSFEEVTEEGPIDHEKECNEVNETTSGQINIADDEFIVDSDEDNVQTKGN